MDMTVSLDLFFFFPPQAHPFSRDWFSHLFLWCFVSQGKKNLGRTSSSLCWCHSFPLSIASYFTFSLFTPTWMEECRCLSAQGGVDGGLALCMAIKSVLFSASLLTPVSWSKWNFWDFLWSISLISHWLEYSDCEAFCLDKQQTLSTCNVPSYHAGHCLGSVNGLR